MVFIVYPCPVNKPCQNPKFSPNLKAELTPSPGMECTFSILATRHGMILGLLTKLDSIENLSSARQVSNLRSLPSLTHKTAADPLLHPGSTPRYVQVWEVSSKPDGESDPVQTLSVVLPLSIEEPSKAIASNPISMAILAQIRERPSIVRPAAKIAAS